VPRLHYRVVDAADNCFFSFCVAENNVEVLQERPQTRDQSTQCDTEQSDPCIWNSDELWLLRKTSQSARDDNARLRGEVTVLQGDLEKLTSARRAERHLVESTCDQLRAARTANTRLQLLVKSLKTEQAIFTFVACTSSTHAVPFYIV